MQVLPSGLWSRTALADWSPGILRSQGVGHPGWEPEYGSDGPAATPPVPVVNLASGELRGLALLLTGRGTVRLPGFAPAAAVEEPTDEPRAGSDDPAARFARTASPNARRLAVLLAASPVVNLQVLRLVAEACARPGEPFLPEHHAEVWLGGLLVAAPDAGQETDRDRVFYQFPTSVRRSLLKWLDGAESREVLQQVAVYIEGNLGRMPGLVAAVHDPLSGQTAAANWRDPLSDGVRGLLHRMGGNHHGAGPSNATSGGGSGSAGGGRYA